MAEDIPQPVAHEPAARATHDEAAVEPGEPQARRHDSRECAPVSACTRVIKFLTDHPVPASIGISVPPYTEIDGYRHLNVFVEFDQQKPDEAPVDLGVIFAFDSVGDKGARHYVTLEENVPSPQSTQIITVSGAGTWHGSPHNRSSYVARFPVIGPFVEVFVYNQAPHSRRVSVWGYLVS